MSLTFTDNSDKFFNDLDRGIALGMAQGAELLTTNIAKLTPVRTGLLRSSIQPTEKIEPTLTGFKTNVFTPVEYAPEVEFGTTRQRPRAMFRKGGDESFKPVENIIKRNLPK